MSDPFQDAHRKAERDADKAVKDAQQKSAAQQIQQRITARADAAKRPANSDIGHPWPEKFYTPRR